LEKKDNIFALAIIGCGPRGLSALESLYAAAKDLENLPNCVIVEHAKYLGAGPIYDLDQPDTNWLNVSERTIAIPPRSELKFKEFTIPSFPNFQHWSGYAKRDSPESEVDSFPSRSKLGQFLNERYLSISKALISSGLLSIEETEADQIEQIDGLLRVRLVGGKSLISHEVALCIGHQPIKLDDQLSKWQTRVQALDGIDLFTQPYPVKNIIDLKGFTKNSSVAIRGFGLAMIDVARILSIGLGGKFKLLDDSSREMDYIPSGKEPKKVLAFSLDGLPMTPKPVNKKIDKLFVPSKKNLSTYKISVQRQIDSNESLSSTDFLTSAIAPIVVDKFVAMKGDVRKHSLREDELEELVLKWLDDEDIAHDLILSKEISAYDAMLKFVNMATGDEKISLDYCIGQVWRHTQPTMYKLLSFAPLSDALIADIVQLDERLKRYTYGPPIDSLQQILALVRSGILDLDYVKNPDIDLGEDGYIFNTSGKTTETTIMINSVLDAPQILKVVSPLPKGLINTSLIEPIHDKLGVRTREDALIETENGVVPVAMMGRLAKGTLIGVDAVAECFGNRSDLWAEGFVGRFKGRI